MKLIGIMPVRNEAWVLGLSARVALLWCDELLILDHASTDETPEIWSQLISEYPGRVGVHREPDPRWDEMLHRQKLLEYARLEGATHIAIVDADEILTGNLLSEIRSIIKSLWHGSVLRVPGYNLRGSLTAYHSSGIWGHKAFSLAFPDSPELHWEGDRFHQREPMGMALHPCLPISQGSGGVMHLWGASERRLKAKHALYKMVERIRWIEKPNIEIDRQYSLAIYGEPGESGVPETWDYETTEPTWWEPYMGLLNFLDVDSEPWQIRECERLMDEYGAATFQRLDLFGIV